MSTDASLQYVTLGLGSEVFAVEVARVREILDVIPICRLPNAPAFMLGMIDVRGVAVPVIDLRVKLGLAPVAATEQTRIVVLMITVEDQERPIGLLADRVFEVTALADDGVEMVPNVGVRWRSDYISAIGRHNGGFVIIFDMTRLLTSSDVALLEQAA